MNLFLFAPPILIKLFSFFYPLFLLFSMTVRHHFSPTPIAFMDATPWTPLDHRFHIKEEVFVRKGVGVMSCLEGSYIDDPRDCQNIARTF